MSSRHTGKVISSRLGAALSQRENVIITGKKGKLGANEQKKKMAKRAEDIRTKH